MKRHAYRHGIAILILLVLAGRYAAADSIIGAIGTLKRSIVPVFCLDPLGKPSGALHGTAFFINGRGQIVTALHVIQSFSETPDQCTKAIYIPVRGWNEREDNFDATAIRLGVCIGDIQDDIAVCDVSQNPFAIARLRPRISAVTFDVSSLPEGTVVMFSGFSLGRRVPITVTAHVGGYASSTRLIVDETAQPGHSGSPLYEQNDEVAGLVTSIDAGQTYATTAQTIVRFFKTFHLRFQAR